MQQQFSHKPHIPPAQGSNEQGIQNLIEHYHEDYLLLEKKYNPVGYHSNPFKHVKPYSIHRKEHKRSFSIFMCSLLFLCVFACVAYVFHIPYTLITVQQNAQKNYNISSKNKTPLILHNHFLSANAFINTASIEELDAIKGIGPVLAQTIVNERDKQGQFYYYEDVMYAKGVGKNKLKAIIDYCLSKENSP